MEPSVDSSFRSDYRESWGLVNLLQIAGRDDREGDWRLQITDLAEPDTQTVLVNLL